MSTEGVIVEDTINSCRFAPGSPKNRLKFLCSHGGKVLPLPADGHLMYVGGETRVISVPRDIGFQEVMTKLTYLIDGEMLLKYQLLQEDLDALVSVKSDEDLGHMVEEHDRYESAGSSRLRAFLFPANLSAIENKMASTEHRELELRYIDAINGIIRATPSSKKPSPTIIVGQRGTFISSACSSPTSPKSCTTKAMCHESPLQGCQQTGEVKMQKVESSPSIRNLNIPQQTSHSVHSHNYYQNLVQSPQLNYQSSKPPTDPHRYGASERLVSIRSIGRVEGVKYQVDRCPYNYYSTPWHNRGSRCCTRCMHCDDCCHGLDKRMIDRTGRPSMSPTPLTPRNGYSILRA
ncbi:unnamed protein product [Fraxinus pennsylvanica]|uniref:PB1 domain-containing protein n=1 Tax=Fraxinus pennsylvanica TaxID=56036 RepID=A0AAD2ADK2_9LAMI|nr:unnamed protein product [Fraxinus pennsylvanica]